MEERPTEEKNVITFEGAGKGLAFLGMIVFLLNMVFYLMSRAQPQQFYLFAGTNHLMTMTAVALVFVITGYVLTRIKPKSTE